MRWIIGLICLISIAVAAFIISPFGWTELESEAAREDIIYDESYQEAALEAGALIERIRQEIGAPAFSAAVGYQGHLIWAGATGWADVETGAPAMTTTRFRIGSTSKSVTATAFARLVQQGVIDPETPIGEIMDVPNPDWAPVTPRQLASHTAGLPGYEENRDIAGAFQTLCLCRTYTDVEEALDVFDDTELLYPPGTDFHYSSFDVNLLSAVLQNAAHRPFLELMAGEVWGPLGMTATGADHTSRDTSGDATFYQRRGHRVRPTRDVDLSQKWAGGGFLSTSSDLVRLGLAWLDDDYIDPATREFFWTPQVLADGTVNEQGYALGWRVGESTRVYGEGHPTRVAHHGGVSKGAQSFLIVLPDEELVVAININTRADEFDDFGRAWAELARIFLDAANAREDTE